MKLKLIIILICVLLGSCDPFGMSCIENSSNDTLTIKLKGRFGKVADNEFCNCESFYRELLYSNDIKKYRELWDWHEIMDTVFSVVHHDTMLEISIPPKGIIITNQGILALRLFTYCPFEFAVFELNGKRDTLFDIQNFGSEDYKKLVEKNDFKIHRESWWLSKMQITEIAEIK